MVSVLLNALDCGAFSETQTIFCWLRSAGKSWREFGAVAAQQFMQPRPLILAQPGLLLVRCTDAARVRNFGGKRQRVQPQQASHPAHPCNRHPDCQLPQQTADLHDSCIALLAGAVFLQG